MCDNFELLDQAFTSDITNACDTNKCRHINTVKENTNTNICEDCGQIISNDISYDKEWRYYGASDTKHMSDPNRCHMRKINERTIYNDVTGLGFSDKIIMIANKLYDQVTNKKIYRGSSRRAIVFACIFHAYKLENNPQNHEHLIEIFNINRKSGLRGLKHVNLYAPKNSPIRTTYITPENLIKDIMEQFDAPSKQIDEVIDIYKSIKNKSSILNRSRPQSVASGLVRYYILIKHKDISINEFREKVKLSVSTIDRIVKEIASILKTDHLIQFC
jgi:transcription initiation factor TFIIIB Brf1 subunit/transcription initiation factor TFIIB